MSVRQAKLFEALAGAIMARLVEDERAGRAERHELGASVVETYGEWLLLVDGREHAAHARHRQPGGDWELTLLGSSPLVDRFVWHMGDGAAKIHWHTGQVARLVITPNADGYCISYDGAELDIAFRPTAATGDVRVPEALS
jgi:hypothetical protein